MAAQIAHGLSVDKWSSPRAIKRFLNAWGVRMAIANARGTNLNLQVMLKLYILEDRFPESFATLVESQPEARGTLLDNWEAWARADTSRESGDSYECPDGIGAGTKAWAATDPRLGPVSGQIDAYLTVAATFTAVSAGEGLPSEALKILDDLLDESEPVRRIAAQNASDLDFDVRAGLIRRLIERSGAVNTDIAIESAAALAMKEPQHAQVFHEAVQTYAMPFLTPASLVDIAGVDGAEETLSKIDGTAIDSEVRGVARAELAELRSRGN